MTESTAVAKVDEGRPLTEIVREGALLPEERWTGARIAAARSLLPPDFQSNAQHMIAFLARAERSGLDPFLNELWAWKNEHGNLQFMTGRDGWLRLAAEDPKIKAVEFALVYEEDEYEAEKTEGRWIISHRTGLAGGDVRGAYCNVLLADGTSHLEQRTYADYAHLLNKKNWKNHPKDMLLTRVVSTAIKFCSPRGAGLYSPAHADDLEVEGEGVIAQVVQGKTQARTNAIRAKLEKQKEREGKVSREIEVEAKESGDGAEEGTERTGDAADPPSEAEPSDDAPEPAQLYPCEFCEFVGDTPQSMGGHGRQHKREKRMKETLEAEGYRIERIDHDEGVGFVGYLHDQAEVTADSWLECYDRLTSDGAHAAGDDVSGNGEGSGEGGGPGAVSAPPAGYDGEPPPDGYRIMVGSEPGTYDAVSADGELVAEGMGTYFEAVAKAHMHADPGGPAEPEQDGPAEGAPSYGPMTMAQIYTKASELGLDPRTVNDMIQERPYSQFSEDGAPVQVWDLPAEYQHRLVAQMEELARG